MSAGVTTPLEEYLAHTYHPDCEYVDGQLVERNVGEYFHSLVQGAIITYLNNLRSRYGKSSYRVLPECRVRVRGGDDARRRYRIPDVTVMPVQDTPTSIILEPPLVAIEILSPVDRFIDVVRKCSDYEAFGISRIWLVDPQTRQVWTVRDGVADEIPESVTVFVCESGQVEVDFNEIFATLDLN